MSLTRTPLPVLRVTWLLVNTLGVSSAFAGAALASTRADRIVDETFSVAERDAQSFVDVLKPTILPTGLKHAAIALVAAAKAHVQGRPLSHYGKTDGGDKVAEVETQDGRVAKLDTHSAGFIELFAHAGLRESDWGNFYLFGNAQNKLSAVTHRRLVVDPRTGARSVEHVEAYHVPATKGQSWVLLQATHPLGKDESFHVHDGRSFVAELREAGFQLHDTGPQRAILPASKRSLRRALRTLAQNRAGVSVLRAGKPAR